MIDIIRLHHAWHSVLWHSLFRAVSLVFSGGRMVCVCWRSELVVSNNWDLFYANNITAGWDFLHFRLLQKAWTDPHHWVQALVLFPYWFISTTFMSFPSVMIGLDASHFLLPQHINSGLWFCGSPFLLKTTLPQGWMDFILHVLCV